MRSPRPAIIAFNVPKDRNPNKAIKELTELGYLGNGTPADIAGFNGHLEVLEVLQAAFWNSTQGQVIADASTASSYHSTPSTGSLYDVDDQIVSD